MSTKHSISLDRLKELTTRYEKNKTKILKDEFHGNGTLPTCETFERAAFDDLLAHECCVGIVIFYGIYYAHFRLSLRHLFFIIVHKLASCSNGCHSGHMKSGFQFPAVHF